MTPLELDVDVLGGARAIAQSHILVHTSRVLCAEASLLAHTARGARARAAAIRRALGIPHIAGGAGDDGPTRRTRIAAKVTTGALPSDTVPRLWGRPGAGETCDGCDEIVGCGALAIESQTAVGRTMVFHAGCFHEWERECKNRQHEREIADRASTDGSPARRPGVVAALLEAFFARSPLCHACLVSASRAGATECDRALDRIAAALDVRRYDARCRACGRTGEVLRLNAPPLHRTPRPGVELT